MPKIIPEMGVHTLKTDKEMTYLENKNINKAICQKLSKKDVYETYTHKIYNIIVVQKNEQLQEKSASDTIFQVVKTVRNHIGYLTTLKCYSYQNNMDNFPSDLYAWQPGNCIKPCSAPTRT